jgi:nicotinamide mononucleotide (NMN) deamidase PncC
MTAKSDQPGDLIRRIHASPLRLVLAITGGGSRAIAELLETPGGSRTILEAVVPYSSAALVDWLGAAPEHFCDARTARAMGMAGFRRARILDQPADAAAIHAGVSCTASLVSDRPKRGPHRVHVACQTLACTASWSLELKKGHRSRAEEEEVVAQLILFAVAYAAGIDEGLSLPLIEGECVRRQMIKAPRAWQRLLRGDIRVVSDHAPSLRDGVPVPLTEQERPPSRAPRAVFPGAFNPLHDGHRQMAAVAGRLLNLPVEFEISIANVDKPPLDYVEMAARSAQFHPVESPLWFTHAATFVEKARNFPGATFIVGVDTIARLAEPRYYGNDPAACRAALDEIASLGCRFLVFGRQAQDGFHTLSEVPLPDTLRTICQEVPEATFRQDISSTELRRAATDD